MISSSTSTMHSSSTPTTQISASAQLMDRSKKADSVAKRCGFCLTSSAQLLRCARCRLIYYCNRECQASAWATHKTFCGSVQKVKTSWTGTEDDFMNLFLPLPAEEEVVCRFQKEDGSIIELTQAAFRQLTGRMSYTPWFRAPLDTSLPEVLLSDIPENEAVLSTGRPEDIATIAQFEHSPPLLFIRKHPQMGLELVAESPIGKGKIICIYTGELRNHQPARDHQEADRRLEGIDGSRCGGIGTFANDGWPNTAFEVIYNYKGLGHVPILYAQTDISKGEPIYCAYPAGHFVKRGEYFIDQGSYNQIVEFCKTRSLLSLANPFDEMRGYYIVSTPPVLIRLLLNEHLNFDEALTFVEHPNIKTHLAASPFYKSYERIFKLIKESLTNGRDIIPQLIGLQSGLSVYAYIMLLSFLSSCKSEERTINFIESCKTLGCFFDCLHEYVYGFKGNRCIYKTEISDDNKETHIQHTTKLTEEIVKLLSSITSPQLREIALVFVHQLFLVCVDYKLVEKTEFLKTLKRR